MRKLMPVLLTAGLCLGTRALAAEVPAAAPAEARAAQALSPGVHTAIAELSSEDYKSREAALKKLQLALGQQMQALVQSDDPEVQSRMTALLQFNEGLTRWIIETYKLPNGQRKAEIAFGLRPEILPILGLVFSADVEKRVEGARALARINHPEVTKFLGRLLEDPERAVYVAAMEAVWDRKANDVIVNALWDRAIEAGLVVYRGGQSTTAPPLKFRGRAIGGVTFADNSYIRRSQDSGIACEVLVHLNAPQVASKIKSFLESYDKATDGSQPNGNVWLYSSNSEPMKNAFRLVESYKSKDVAALLYKIATAPARQKQQGQMNAEKYFWSNRTTALASLIVVIDQKPEDYELKRQPINWGGMWTTPTEADEDKAVKKIQEWWAANGEKFGTKAAEKEANGAAREAAGSQPATPPPNNAAGGANVPPGMINGPLPGGGNVQIRRDVRIQVAPVPEDQ